jgi:peptide/nickel transport system ATP-binding protein
MIAMALAMNPKLLIADEPTTALDVTVQGEIIKLIKDLQRAHNLAVLFITHDFGVVRELGTHVAVMQNGQIVEKGPMREVMANPQHAYTQKLLAAMPRLKTDTTPAPAKAPLLEVTGLRKTFMVKKGGFFSRRVPFEALKGVSFTVGAGEVVGLVGESGCGKSTLAKCLLRLYEPDGGTLRFAGEDVTHLKGQPLRALRRNMQMVFQDPFSSLNPRMRVGESVAEGLRAHNLMPPAERDVFVRDLLADCGLPPDAADRYPHQFSGGQRQRICIARALALKPKLIIADEPVSSLDVSVQKQILELMNQLKEKYGLSYLFISHDLRVVSQVCDRVLVMQRGEIVEQGPAAQVFQNPQHPYTKQLLAAIPGLAA